MKIFVAGASGAIGKLLVPMLVVRGHEVTGMTRSPAKQDLVRQMGARAVLADALDPEAVAQALAEAEPEVVIHELTAIDAGKFGRNFDKAFAVTNRLRRDGTDHLLAAAKAVGARRFVAQSFAPWLYKRVGGPVKAEDDALDDKPPKAVSQTFAAIRHVEETVTRVDGIEGIVLRYGGFYGPGTSIAVDPDGEQVKMIRKGRLPIVGDGAGVWSFVHIEDAASATAAAVERGDPGAYNVVDDDPVPVSEFLPELARVIGAKPSRRVPRWLGRLLGGQATVVMMTVFRRLADIPQPRATRQDRRSVPVHTPRLLPRQRRAAHAPPQGFAERCCGGVHPRPGARVTSRATEVASKTVAWYSITPKAIETLAVAMQAGQGLAFCDRRRVDRAALCAQTEPGAVPISVHGRSPNQGCCGDLSGRLAAVVRKRLPRGRSSADHGEVRRASASARRAS